MEGLGEGDLGGGGEGVGGDGNLIRNSLNLIYCRNQLAICGCIRVKCLPVFLKTINTINRSISNLS